MINMPPPAGNNLFDDSSCWRGSARGSAHAGTAASKKSCNTLLIRLNYPHFEKMGEKGKAERETAAGSSMSGAALM